MPHFRVDDALHSHPKARQAGLEAMGLWNLCGSYCMGYLTDGFVPEWYVKSWPKGAALAKKLVAAKLWTPAKKDGEPGWQFHEFIGPGRQDSRAQIEADRQKWRNKKQRQRGDSPQDSPTVSPGDIAGDTRESPGYTQPNPTQPIDNSPTEESSPNVGGDERGLSGPVSPSASRLVSTLIPQNIPDSVRAGLRIQASQLMNGDGLDGDTVADALRRWLARPGAGVGLLPSLAADVIRERAAPATSGNASKLRAVASLAARQRAAENAQPRELQ